jgi:hypothetical protein
LYQFAWGKIPESIVYGPPIEISKSIGFCEVVSWVLQIPGTLPTTKGSNFYHG